MPSFGTLKADTLTHSTAGSLATNFVVNGSAKAFLSYDFGDDSIPGSFNISSVTDRSTGCLYGNFTNSMNSVGYAVPAGTSPAAEGSMGTGNNNRYSISSGDTTGRYSQNNNQVSSSSTYSDVPYCCAAIHGDLA